MEGTADIFAWIDLLMFEQQTHQRCPHVYDNSACEQHEWISVITDYETGERDAICKRCGEDYGNDAAC